MVCRKFLVVSTILFDLGDIVVSKINASDTRDGRYFSVVDIPEVPGSKQNDDLGNRDNNRAMRHEEDRYTPSDSQDSFRDFHYSEYEDTRRPAHQNSRSGPCEALIEKMRSEFSQDDATITLHNRGNVHNRVPLSYKVSGFNSFHVRQCEPVTRGALTLSLSFNELTFTPSDQERGLGGRRRFSEDYLDHHQGGGGDMVQVYGLGLEYGFVSDNLRGAGGIQSPGVTLTTHGAQFRINGNGRPTTNNIAGQDLINEYKYPLEEYIDNLFHHVVEDLRRGSRDSYRF